MMRLKVNGKWYHPQAAPSTRLLDYLRHELQLTGTKEGCGEGECGACLVLLDGAVVNSCLVLLGQCAEREIVTIEGIDAQPILDAFVSQGAVQCGFCTPGFVVAAYALLQHNPDPSPAEIKAALAGNLCRCTGYRKIVTAVQAAGEQIKRKQVV